MNMLWKSVSLGPVRLHDLSCQYYFMTLHKRVCGTRKNLIKEIFCIDRLLNVRHCTVNSERSLFMLVVFFLTVAHYHCFSASVYLYYFQCIEKSYEAMRENQQAPLPEEAVKYCILGQFS
jgi:hypothetical protein